MADKDLVCQRIDTQVDELEDSLARETKTTAKEDKHSMILHEMHETYCHKNHDYGDSFSQLYRQYGMIYPIIHIEEKLNRIKALTANADGGKVPESIRDSLLDMANYAILAIMERDR